MDFEAEGASWKVDKSLMNVSESMVESSESSVSYGSRWNNYGKEETEDARIEETEEAEGIIGMDGLGAMVQSSESSVS